jgi:hypothetical protein
MIHIVDQALESNTIHSVKWGFDGNPTGIGTAAGNARAADPDGVLAPAAAFRGPDAMVRLGAQYTKAVRIGSQEVIENHLGSPEAMDAQRRLECLADRE